jgi:hypothetical protein
MKNSQAFRTRARSGHQIAGTRPAQPPSSAAPCNDEAAASKSFNRRANGRMRPSPRLRENRIPYGVRRASHRAACQTQFARAAPLAKQIPNRYIHIRLFSASIVMKISGAFHYLAGHRARADIAGKPVAAYGLRRAPFSKDVGVATSRLRARFVSPTWYQSSRHCHSR